MKELWVEKYRPKTVDGYVFRDKEQQKQIHQWIAEKSIPHIMLSGHPGIGKTTLAKLLLNEIGVEKLDVLEINASRERGIDEMRNRITKFISTIAFGDFKVVLLDEADYLTRDAQASLRGIMEEYHMHARFILTCNDRDMLLPAIHSRCQAFHLTKIDKTEFTARVAHILIEEGVTPDLAILDKYVDLTYPDLRKCINTVQQNVQDKSLIAINEDDADNNQEWKFELIELFKTGKINKARQLLCGKIRKEEIRPIYRWLYENLELFGDEEKQNSAIIIIKQGLLDHQIAIDPEINLAATLVKLGRL